MKTQILMVHGGMTFKSRKEYLDWLKTRPVRLEKKNSWNGSWFDVAMGRNYEIVRPRMPLQDFARYDDWKIWFERHIPFLRDGCVLVGSSLGGIFLSKYLSEHRFPKRVKSVFLVCPPYDNSDSVEDLVGGFHLGKDLSLLQENAERLHLFFSADDDVVPPSHAAKYRARLPDADIRLFEDKNGHFLVSEFPEIVSAIKKDMKKKG